MIRIGKITPSMTVLESWDDLPEFKSEAEEAEFWATHELGPKILDAMGPLDDVLGPPDPSRRRPAP
jgi:hypothetical protein